MKKLISMILTLAMIFSLSVTAMASELPEDTVINVGAKFEEKEAAAPEVIYAVTITWAANEDNDLTYTKNGVAYVWNPDELKYMRADTQAEDGWTGSAKYTITATNKSNAAVDATIAVAGVNGINAAGDFGEAGSVLNLANAAANVTPGTDVTGIAQSESVDVTVTVSGEKGITEDGNVATITITLSAANVAGE